MRIFAMRSTLCLVTFATSTAALFAQTSSPPAVQPASSVANSFAAEPVVIQSSQIVVTMNADGTGSRDITVAIKIQSSSAVQQFGIIFVPFAGNSDRVQFRYVRVRKPDGTVLETPLTGVLEQPEPVTREAPFYSDLKQKQLPVKNLTVGDTLEWQAHIERFKAEAPGQFWGQENFFANVVSLNETFELRVPSGRAVTVWTNASGDAKTFDTTEGAQHVYRWSRTALKPTVGPEADAAKKLRESTPLTAAQQIEETDGKLPDLAWTTFPTWQAVGDWYRSLESERTTPDATIKGKVAELTAGKTTTEAKVRAVYDYVSGQIRYIGVAFGVGRYQPHRASEVLENQYGDCKDKHTLLAAMLQTLGLQPSAVLIGAGIRFNQAVPSPASFNHLITQVQVDGTTIWLDTTAEVSPYRVLLPQIRDRSALVIPDSSPSAIQRTPAGLPYPAFAIFTAVGSLDKDANSDSHVSLTYRDDDEIVLRAVLRQVTIAQYGQVVEQLMKNMGYGGTVSQGEIVHVDDPSQPVSLNFLYHRTHESDWGANRITTLWMFITLPAIDDKNPPISTLQLGVPRTETSKLELKLPTGWTAELPEAIHAHAPFATCDVTYRLENGTLFAERKLVVLKDKVPASDWKVYKAWYDEAGASGVPYVQLINTGGLTNAAPIVNNSEAEKLVEEARQAIVSGQTDHALDLLNQAKKINPQQRGLWGNYAFRAYQLGIPTEAIDSYRKELNFHPDAVWVYGPLVEELLRTDRKAEALTTLHSAVAADPTNAWDQTMLVNLLYADNDMKGAVAAGTEALKHVAETDPQAVNVKVALASAQIATGEMAPAAEQLKASLQAATTPSQKNSLAYLLAETGLDLSVAEEAEKSALASLATESHTWTLDEAPATLKQTSSLITASWDTLGYIYFREGHLPEARAYIEAAWSLRQDAEVGQHLGDIELAQHQPDAALTTYQRALSTMPPARFAAGLPPATLAASARIQLGIAQAKQAGARPSTADPRQALQKLRSVSLGLPPAKIAPHGEYRLLIAHGNVEAIRSIGEGVPALEALLRQASFARFIPAGSDAKIVLVGYVNCVSTPAKCEFIPEP